MSKINSTTVVIPESVKEQLKKEVLEAFPGVVVTVNNLNIWVSGDTKPIKDELKAFGFRWASKRKAWFMRVPDTAKPYEGYQPEAEAEPEESEQMKAIRAMLAEYKAGEISYDEYMERQKAICAECSARCAVKVAGATSPADDTAEYAYLMTRRPYDIGTAPANASRIEYLDGNTTVHTDYNKCLNFKPWNIVYYSQPLPIEEVERYELTPKFDFTDGLLTEWFEIREEVKAENADGYKETVESVCEFIQQNSEWLSDWVECFLNPIRWYTLSTIDWIAIQRLLEIAIPNKQIAGYLPAPKEEAEPELELPGMPETEDERLQRVYSECVNIMHDAGLETCGQIISVKINRRLSRSWGRCKTNLKSLNHEIEVRKTLFECDSDTPLKSTILHELCHTVNLCWHGHDANFRNAARKIEAITGLSIARATCIYAELEASHA